MESLITTTNRNDVPAPVRVLLWAAEPFATATAEWLTARLGATVSVVHEQRQCQELLEEDEFTLVLLEESMVLENEVARHFVYDRAGAAVTLEINFGISDRERILGQVQAALARRARDQRMARQAAVSSLQSELSASVSGLLLESASALRKAGPDLAPSLEQLITLSESLSRQLRA